MPNDGVWGTILTFLSGGAFAAILVFIGDRVKFREERKAVKEDRAEEKDDRMKQIEKSLKDFDERLARMEEHDIAQSEALKLILLDRILYLGSHFIKQGEVSFDDRKRLHAMHDAYHKGLHGNGDADLVMSGVDELSLKK